MTDIPEWSSIKTIALQLDCAESTVLDYTNRGLLPQPVKIGGLVRWNWNEVDAAMKNAKATRAGTDHNQTAADPILARIHAS